MAINLHNNKAPIAVGTAWLSSEDMYMAAKKGKCVNIKHFYGDQLWAAGTRDQLPDLGPTELESAVVRWRIIIFLFNTDFRIYFQARL